MSGMLDVIDLVASWAEGRERQGSPVAALSLLVSDALAHDPAFRTWLDETTSGAVTGRSRLRVALALEEAAERDPRFGRHLAEAVGTATSAPLEPAGFPVVRFGGVVADDVDVVGPLFFGRDDAERDLADGLLRDGFLPTTVYAEVLNGRKNLIIGRKGTGKSAICVRLSMNGAVPGETCLITPDDAVGEELRHFVLGGLTNAAAKALLWRYVLAVHAARFLVRHASGGRHGKRRPASVKALERFLRDNGELDDMSLYHRIVAAGRGLRSSFSLEAFGLIKLGAEGGGEAQGVRASRQADVLESGVRRAFADLGCERKGHGALLFLVDQLEQVWLGEQDSEAFVIGLLLAGKHAALTYGGSIRCAFFLRSDIYDSLSFSDADKFHSDEIRISWNTKQLHDLALARARASLGRDLTPDELWGEVFPAEVDGEPTADYLFTRSLPRPRDVIQFLNQCRDTALAAGRHRITEDDVREATLVFSRWKTRDLPKEYGTRFPFLTELLVVFRDASHLLTRDGIAELLLVHQDSLMQRHSRYEDLLNADVVIELLFSVGFLGVRRRGRYVYGGAEERAVQPYESDFCVHPCFRPALNTTEPPALAALEMPPDHGVVVQTGYIRGGINTSNSFGGADVDISPRDDERG